MSKQCEVVRLPNCDFCKGFPAVEARYDGKTVHGPWAYMCERHWKSMGIGKLGTGYGQRLYTPEELPLEELNQ